MAKALVKYETLDAKQVEEIMLGKDPSPPEGWTDSVNKRKSSYDYDSDSDSDSESESEAKPESNSEFNSKTGSNIENKGDAY